MSAYELLNEVELSEEFRFLSLKKLSRAFIRIAKRVSLSVVSLDSSVTSSIRSTINN